MKTLKEIKEEIEKILNNKETNYSNGWTIESIQAEGSKKTFNECITAFREMIEKDQISDLDNKGKEFAKMNYSLALLSQLPEVKE